MKQILLTVGIVVAAAVVTAPATSSVRQAGPDEATAFPKLSSPVPGGRLTSAFGARVHPIYKTELFHSGNDIYAPEGTPILAAGDGVVELATDLFPQNPNYGNVVIIKHSEVLRTFYAHLGSFSVEKGQEVSKGDPIATMGVSGSSSGTHLHFEIWKTMNPWQVVGRRN